MKIYESTGSFSPTIKEFSLLVQATKIEDDDYEINQYFDICSSDRFAIVAILSTKKGNKDDLSGEKPDYTFAVTNIPYSKLKRDLIETGDLDITTAVNEKNEITVYVHHAIGFDIKNADDRAVLQNYKNGILPSHSSLRIASPPNKGGKGILL
jgi:hypothetical protein